MKKGVEEKKDGSNEDYDDDDDDDNDVEDNDAQQGCPIWMAYTYTYRCWRLRGRVWPWSV